MALEKIQSVSGTAVYLPGSDIDTDRIIPARFLKCVTFDGLGGFLFHDVRYNPDGTPQPHPLNEPGAATAKVLVTGVNFGCGSSREHAPQAIYRHGFRAIIAGSFAEIFFGNATTLGIACVTAAMEDIEALGARLREDPSTEVTVDIDRGRVFYGDSDFPVTIPETTREALLLGRWDPIADLLEAAPDVAATAAKLPYMQR